MNFETSNRPLWVQLSQSVRAVPLDFPLVVGFVAVLNVVFGVPGLREASFAGASLRTLLGLPAVLFVPGYVLVAVLFPGPAAERVGDGDPALHPVGSIDLLERLALSFGLSVALLPPLVIALAAWWEVTLSSVLVVLTVATVVGIGLAAIRRLRRPPDERFGPSIGDVTVARPVGRRGADSFAVRVSSIVLVLAIVAAVGAVGFSVATPYESGSSSTVFLTTENETGEAVAADYPTDLTVGESAEVSVGIRNDEEGSQPYTVVVVMERVESAGDGTTVMESRELTRLQPSVDADATWTRSHTVTPQLVGEDLRLHYYLYRGEEGPAEPDPASAYRDVYLWVDVSEA